MTKQSFLTVMDMPIYLLLLNNMFSFICLLFIFVFTSPKQFSLPPFFPAPLSTFSPPFLFRKGQIIHKYQLTMIY